MRLDYPIMLTFLAWDNPIVDLYFMDKKHHKQCYFVLYTAVYCL